MPPASCHWASLCLVCSPLGWDAGMFTSAQIPSSLMSPWPAGNRLILALPNCGMQAHPLPALFTLIPGWAVPAATLLYLVLCLQARSRHQSPCSHKPPNCQHSLIVLRWVHWVRPADFLPQQVSSWRSGRGRGWGAIHAASFFFGKSFIEIPFSSLI